MGPRMHPWPKNRKFCCAYHFNRRFYQNITILNYIFFSCQVVSDGDISKNAEYELELENIENSEGVFEVHPTKAVGRTPVIIRVVNPDRLDYEKEEGRSFVLKVNALQNGQLLSSAFVTILVRDANDNVPLFDRPIYRFSLREDAQSGESIGKEGKSCGQRPERPIILMKIQESMRAILIGIASTLKETAQKFESYQIYMTFWSI